MYRHYRCIDIDVQIQNDRCINIIKGDLLKQLIEQTLGSPTMATCILEKPGSSYTVQGVICLRNRNLALEDVRRAFAPLYISEGRHQTQMLVEHDSRHRKTGAHQQEAEAELGRQASQAAFFWTFFIYMCHLPPCRKCQSSILWEHPLPFVSSSWEHAHKHSYPKA